LILNFGIRYDRWREFEASSSTFSIASGQTTLIDFPDRSEHSFSPRIGALYQITDSVSVLGSYSRSFRGPTLNELYRAFRVGNVITLANENLRAEVADTYEAGAIFTDRSGRFSVRGNVFQANVARPVFSVTLNSTPT
jgi:outer membrane receptor protein involved in Fe transport